MAFLKFINQEHIDAVLTGKLKFTKLSYYKLLELVTKDAWIGDRDEGVARVNTGEVVLAGDGTTEEARQLLNKSGFIYAEKEATGDFSNNTIDYIGPDYYVWCFSAGPVEALVSAMCLQPEPKYRYDSCIEITDLRLLSDAIALPRAITAMSGARVASESANVTWGPVVYTGHDVGPDASLAEPSPFRKKAIYESQREWRFVIEPPLDLELDHIIFEVASPELFLREVFRGREVGRPVQAPWSGARKVGEIAADILNLCDAMVECRRDTYPSGIPWEYPGGRHTYMEESRRRRERHSSEFGSRFQAAAHSLVCEARKLGARSDELESSLEWCLRVGNSVALEHQLRHLARVLLLMLDV